MIVQKAEKEFIEAEAFLLVDLVKWRQDDVKIPSVFATGMRYHRPLQAALTVAIFGLQKPADLIQVSLLKDSGIRMSLGRTIYNALFRRTSTFVVTIVVGGFLFERVFDEGMDNLWENMNRGVSILNTRWSFSVMFILT